MFIFAVRVFCIGSIFVTLAFSQTQTAPPAQASPTPSPSPTTTKPATKQANIWQQRVDEAIHPKKPSLASGGIEILSDTMGVDFEPYVSRLKEAVQKRWYSLMPESAMAPQRKSGKTVIKFAVMRDGRVENVKIEQSAGDVELDRAAYGALVYSSPLAKLPAAFPGDSLLIRANFFYNPTKVQSKPEEKKGSASDNVQWNPPKESPHL
ncbi:MAG TPA: energy transducer TonB [Candidatus Angelobacter sp.]|jgi:TonB family protein|nr:energy transducer TonB [Candidatus Angelobacter sp.]